ncbi:MAG: NAD-dependent epimerase/dehydratase family protein [Oligoflexia bacterium]|nr:NAD-dependent epimerase/dehydratase family protein [Oligoflexia bacterium]
MGLNFRSALVTGGGGFVGNALCKRLRQDQIETVSVSRGEYPDLAALGVRSVRMDLSSNISALYQVLKGVEVVFHTAAKVDMWGDYQAFYLSNVVATQNLLSVAKAAGVRRFVFTSSPSVIANGADLEGIDESQPYPKHYSAHYPRTKAIAERMVLKANGPEFRTVSLRPHLIFGPGDHHLVPTIIERARAGRLPQVGAGKNKVDLCFIDDCVEAHICAAVALADSSVAAGRAYFVSQGEPVLLWDWIAELVARAGLPPLKRRVAVPVARCLAQLSELISDALPWKVEPLLTKFLVEEMSTSHYFNISAARNLLHFQPRFTVSAALEKTMEGFANRRDARL